MIPTESIVYCACVSMFENGETTDNMSVFSSKEEACRCIQTYWDANSGEIHRLSEQPRFSKQSERIVCADGITRTMSTNLSITDDGCMYSISCYVKPFVINEDKINPSNQ